MKDRFIISKEVKVGDLLTVGTIIISLISVLISWNVDRQIQLKKDADIIREAAANTLGDLERWRNLELSIFDEAQPIFFDVSDAAVAKWPQIDASRDLLWKKLYDIHNTTQRKILDERLDNGYVRMLSYYPKVREMYQDATVKMRNEDRLMMFQLLQRTQDDLDNFKKKANRPLHSAAVFNALHQTALKIKTQFSGNIQSDLTTNEKFLTSLVKATDARLNKRQ